MNKNIDELLKHKMSIDEIQSVPELSRDTLKKIAERKKRKQDSTSLIEKIIELCSVRFRIASLGLVMVGIIFGINYLYTLNIEKGNSQTSNASFENTMTVSSNTFLATLTQPTTVEVPVNTTTALTSIATFVARN